ncbi:UNVERIFIED_CONTAM: hypothetical protein FKN15_045136 [Acipenser sinensis]
MCVQCPREILDWLVDTKGNFEEALPMAINLLWARDGEQWEAWEQQHHLASLTNLAAVVINYQSLVTEGEPHQSPEIGDYLLLPPPPLVGDYLLLLPPPLEGDYLLLPPPPPEELKPLLKDQLPPSPPKDQPLPEPATPRTAEPAMPGEACLPSPGEDSSSSPGEAFTTPPTDACLSSPRTLLYPAAAVALPKVLGLEPKKREMPATEKVGRGEETISTHNSIATAGVSPAEGSLTAASASAIAQGCLFTFTWGGLFVTAWGSFAATLRGICCGLWWSLHGTLSKVI